MEVGEYSTPDVTFNPGPSELMPNVRDYYREGVELSRLSHRGEVFREIYQNTVGNLRTLLQIPPDHMVAFVGSATAAMELTPLNCAEQDTLHLVNGAFSQRWHNFASGLGRNAREVVGQWGSGLDMSDERIAIAFDPIRAGLPAELSCVVQNETSTGVALDPQQITWLKDEYPGSLLAVDITSSVPYVDIDIAKTDVAFFSVQKGFGMPAGLGILIASPEAVGRSKELQQFCSIGAYQTFDRLAEQSAKGQTPETPNMAAIYALGRVAQDMQGIGIDQIRGLIDAKAKHLYDFFDSHGQYEPFVREPAWRSPTVIVVEVEGGSSAIVQRLAEEHNVAVGKGYGEYGNQQIRIGNFPAHTSEAVVDLVNLLNN